MINIAKLKHSDIGRWVEYNNGFGTEEGKIKSWNDINIFVVYKCDNQWERFQDFTGVATRPQDLVFKDGEDLK